MAISQADRIAVFGLVGFPVIALRFRRDVPAGILEANGAKQKARQCSCGGRVLDGLVVGFRVGFYWSVVMLLSLSFSVFLGARRATGLTFDGSGFTVPAESEFF